MPLPSAWNRRYLTVGNGGWAGAVHYDDIVWGLEFGRYYFNPKFGERDAELDRVCNYEH
jgi:hypothetical protein